MKSIVLAIVPIAILVTGNALPALAAESATPRIFLAEPVTPSPSSPTFESNEKELLDL